MNAGVVWHGTDQEARELSEAIGRNCGCETADGVFFRCAAHRMLYGDQRAIDGLLFARRIADRLLQEEFGGSPPTAPQPAAPAASTAPERGRRGARRRSTAPAPGAS
ncbi:MAG TPA: hypothetical protein VG370_30245 [Chloroflexota bacterium]|jgi:hypothetical protein|nr:hypothetical protein [Chloroflexota bacterium]